MNVKSRYFLFILACFIKILLSLAISLDISFLIINFVLISIILYMVVKKYNISIYVPMIMLDFLVQSFICFDVFGYELNSLIISVIYFLTGSSFLYILIITKAGEKNFKKISNIKVDEGIKALESENYDLAIELFSNAIKEYKKNYLGYMGMCNTLTKMDSKNIKKIKYYKKKCIKYAPSELKESIDNKY